ncbi:MAG: NINE protein [Ekhidna sp.]
MFWDQARLLSSFQHSYQGSYEKALSILETYSPENKLYQGTSQLQQAGIALLQRDVSEFERLEQSFGNYYQLTPYEEVLSLSKKELAEIKPKSPFVAGLLSSIVPGAGRFYIGKPGEGIATLLVAGIFTAQTLEAYRKDGVRDPRFIIFGSLLSITYVSNIWGSVLAVKVSNLEKNNQINENILLNMHIPLRVIFD